MKKSAIILALALGASALSLTAQDQGGSPPAGERPPGHEGGPGGRVGRGGFHLLPPPAIEELKLTADQQKQLTALEAEVENCRKYKEITEQGGGFTPFAAEVFGWWVSIVAIP